MDERQAQIKEGAGLDESRVNQEFIDLLQKWSTPVLLLLTVAALAWWGWQRLEVARYNARDVAFADLSESQSGASINPQVLESIADDYSGVPDVVVLAKQSAASAYLAAMIRGLEPTATLDDDGNPTDPSMVLDEQERARYAQRARALFTEIIEMTGDSQTKALLAMNASYGLAALSETEGNSEDAVRWYERAAAYAEAGRFELQVKIANARAASVNDIEAVTLISEAQVARLPEPERPEEGVPPQERLGIIPPPAGSVPAGSVPADSVPAPEPAGPEVPATDPADGGSSEGANDGTTGGG